MADSDATTKSAPRQSARRLPTRGTGRLPHAVSRKTIAETDANARGVKLSEKAMECHGGRLMECHEDRTRRARRSSQQQTAVDDKKNRKERAHSG